MALSLNYREIFYRNVDTGRILHNKNDELQIDIANKWRSIIDTFQIVFTAIQIKSNKSNVKLLLTILI